MFVLNKDCHESESKGGYPYTRQKNKSTGSTQYLYSHYPKKIRIGGLSKNRKSQ